MAKRKQVTPAQIYQLKITLRDTRPPIWRRVLVGDTTTLHELHWIMQIAMGCIFRRGVSSEFAAVSTHFGLSKFPSTHCK